MRNVLAMASLLLVGCSILPDDSFKNIPQTRLQKITITSNTGNDPFTGGVLDPGEFPSLSAVGEVSTTSTKVLIEWSGDLKLFWFSSPVVSTEYTINNSNLLLEITNTMESGAFQTESLTYGENGKLEKLVSNYDDSYLAVYDFYYVDGELDSISKYTEFGSYIYSGFFKRNYDADAGQQKFSFIYPFIDDSDWSVQENEQCEPFFTVNSNVGRMCYFTFSSGFQRLEAKIAIPDFDDYYYYNHSDLNYETDFSGLLGKVQRVQLFNKENNDDCGPVKSLSLNYYSLLDPLNENYQLLAMIDAAESMISMTWEPDRTTPYVDLTFDYEYIYAE
jgi:hypothetical protein